MDPTAQFELRYFENSYNLTKTETRTGAELAELRVGLALPTVPPGANVTIEPDVGSGSLLIEYSRVQQQVA